MTDDLRLLTLLALFDLAQENRPAHLGNLAARLASPRVEVVVALKDLERKGLLDAARCRLTMSGLVAARTLRTATSGVDRARSAA